MMSVNGGAGDAKKIKAVERRLLALELRKLGGREGSYRNIAAALKARWQTKADLAGLQV